MKVNKTLNLRSQTKKPMRLKPLGFALVLVYLRLENPKLCFKIYPKS